MLSKNILNQFHYTFVFKHFLLCKPFRLEKKIKPMQIYIYRDTFYFYLYECIVYVYVVQYILIHCIFYTVHSLVWRAHARIDTHTYTNKIFYQLRNRVCLSMQFNLRVKSNGRRIIIIYVLIIASVCVFYCSFLLLTKSY